MSPIFLFTNFTVYPVILKLGKVHIDWYRRIKADREPAALAFNSWTGSLTVTSFTKFHMSAAY